MDQIVAQALTVYGKIVGMKRKEAAAARMPAGAIIPYSNGKSPKGNGRSVVEAMS